MTKSGEFSVASCLAKFRFDDYPPVRAVQTTPSRFKWILRQRAWRSKGS